MFGLQGLAPGQRWRSYHDGHTVVTVERRGAQWFVRFDESGVSAAIDTADFLDDYAFLEHVGSVATATD